MWMGSGMTPMMFPGVQHYMSRMGMAMGPPALPSIHNPMHLPRVPVADQSMIASSTTDQSVLCQTPAFNPINYQNQIQNASFQEQYARYMGFHPMQTVSQVCVLLLYIWVGTWGSIWDFIRVPNNMFIYVYKN